MKCPNPKTWDLMAMNVLTGEEADSLTNHARSCSACESTYQRARRAHVERMRMYEAFDRDHDNLREQLLAALANQLPDPSSGRGLASGWDRLGGFVMKLNTYTNRRTAAVLAPAACIVIAVLILLANSQSRVFAAALARFREAGTIVCDVTTTINIKMEADLDIEGAADKLPNAATLKPTETVRNERLYLSDTHGVRRDTLEDGAIISTAYTSPAGSTLILNHSDQTYQEFDVDDELRKMAVEAKGPDVHFMSLAQNPDRLLRGLRDLTFDAQREIGREGPLIGYAIPAERVGLPVPAAGQPNQNRAELWVDAEDGEVAKLVFHTATFVAGSEVVPLKASFTMTIVYERFAWDPPLEKGWFTANVPDAYTSLSQNGQPTTMRMPDEAALLEALRVFAEVARRYPSSLSAMDASYEVSFLIGSIQARVIQAKRSGKTDPTIPDIAAVGKQLQGLALYALLEAQGREPRYFGASVQPGDTEHVLMQWTLENAERRVIYGDLRVETLPPE